MRTRSLLCGSWTPQLLSCCCCFCCSLLPNGSDVGPVARGCGEFGFHSSNASAPTDHKWRRERESDWAHTRKRESAWLAWVLSQLAFALAFDAAHSCSHTHTRLCWILFVDASADRQQQLLLSDYTHTHPHACTHTLRSIAMIHAFWCRCCCCALPAAVIVLVIVCCCCCCCCCA